ncbi:MAG: hypothetical protein KY437_09170 [Actinobacteria bacterium]|nr:hypothetical protein [Actinomycetota bacterium]
MTLLTLLLLAACGGTSGPTADGRSPTGDASPSPISSGAAFVGTLGGDAQLEGGCAWLETETEGRVEPRWPDGYRVVFDPVRLLGPDGETVAEEGDTVEVHGEIADDVMTICQVGPVLEVTEIVGSSRS